MTPHRTSINDLLSIAAGQRPHASALRDARRTWTYRELEEEAGQLSARLRVGGIPQGARVAVLARNCGEVVVSLFACVRGGWILTPLNFRYAPAELRAVLEDCMAEVLVATDEFRDVVDALRPALPFVRLFIGVAHDGPGWVDLRTASGQADHDAAIACSPNSPALLLYTSGTTGRPKGVLLGHAGLVHVANHARTIWADWDESDVNLIVVPLFHVGGIVLLLVAIAAQATTVLQAEFQPSAVLAAVQRDRITRMFLVPSMIQSLLQARDCEKTDFSSMRLLVYAAAPMPNEIQNRVIKVMGCAMAQVYGMTESSGAITYLGPQDHCDARLASCGRPTAGTELQIVDDKGQRVAPGEVGEVVIRTRQLMLGYFNQPAATEAVIRDGWFHSGDAGCVDEQGFLYIRDRIKDMIITGGENVYPAEVENALLKLDCVQDAAVVGAPDPNWGEAVTAFIVAAEETRPDEATIRERLRKDLAGYKIPKRVHTVTALPRNASGKLLKGQLRTQARELLGANPS